LLKKYSFLKNIFILLKNSQKKILYQEKLPPIKKNFFNKILYRKKKDLPVKKFSNKENFLLVLKLFKIFDHFFLNEKKTKRKK
jgi:hypothetical protein